MFGKNKKKKELIKNLPELLKRVQEEHMVSPSDIPPAETLQEKLAHCDFTKFPTLKEKLTEAVDSMLDQDIAELMSIVPQDADEPAISGGAFADVKDTMSPFGFMKCEVCNGLISKYRINRIHVTYFLDAYDCASFLRISIIYIFKEKKSVKN